MGEPTVKVARWAIFREEDKQMLFTKKSSFSEATNGQGYQAFVSTHSRALGALSREIAKEIKNVLP